MPRQQRKQEFPGQQKTLSSEIYWTRVVLSKLLTRVQHIDDAIDGTYNKLQDIEVESDEGKDKEIEKLKTEIDNLNNQIEYHKTRYQQISQSMQPAGNTLTVGDVEALRSTNMSLMEQINDYKQREVKLCEQIEQEQEEKRDLDHDKEELKCRMAELQEQLKKARKRKRKQT